MGSSNCPGLAVQRLMRDGYGFGAEGDWKTSALVRAMKVMSAGMKGGVSFMEDYTYHFNGGSGDKVLGAHMLEICESIAAGKPKLDVLRSRSAESRPGTPDLRFEHRSRIGASIMDMGQRFAWWQM